MTRKLVRGLVCEGPDDVAAIRAMLRASRPGMKSKTPSSRWERSVRLEDDECVLTVARATGAKTDLAREALDIAQGTASERPDIIGVVFDPDGDVRETEVRFFEKAFRDLEKARQCGPLRSEAGLRRFTMNGRQIRIEFGAWRAKTPCTFDALPDEHDLERLLIGAILDCPQPKLRRAWAETATKELHAAVADHGWKRAFRLWGAALHPKSETLVEKLLEDDETKTVALAALQSSPVAALLGVLTSP